MAGLTRAGTPVHYPGGKIKIYILSATSRVYRTRDENDEEAFPQYPLQLFLGVFEHFPEFRGNSCQD